MISVFERRSFLACLTALLVVIAALCWPSQKANAQNFNAWHQMSGSRSSFNNIAPSAVVYGLDGSLICVLGRY